MVGSKDDLSMKPTAAIYPSRLSPIRPSLLKAFRQIYSPTSLYYKESNLYE